MSERYVEYISIDDVVPAPLNPKAHDIPELVLSFERFGYTQPLLMCERKGHLAAGHGRLDALKLMREEDKPEPDGIKNGWLVPVVRGWSSQNDTEFNLYLAADNQHTTKSGWDDRMLYELLSAPDVDDLDGTGFNLDDLRALEQNITELLPTPSNDPDNVPAVPKEPVSQPGDIWVLGNHRIICGDCRDFAVVEKLMGGQRVNVAFTSPPYASQRKYDESSGFKPIPPDEYVEWFEDVQANVRAVLADDGSWFVNISPGAEDRQRRRYVHDLVSAHIDGWSWWWVDEYCWPRVGMPLDPKQIGRFKIGFEMVYAFALGDSYKFRPDAVMHESDSAFTYEGSHNRLSNDFQGSEESTTRRQSRTTVGKGMAYPSTMLSSFGSAEAIGHSAAFPVGLPRWFIAGYSDIGDNIYDPFMGSGTTLIAAHEEGRNAFGAEISPAYVDVICKRFQEFTGTLPVLESTGAPRDFTQNDENRGENG